jgi:NAD(P)-dependent dehydrogenase (short-subunit alcohol dehydrogenase family)
MMGIEAFRYDGKRALVVGGTTGMGAATVQILQDLGAEVVNMDYAPSDKEGVRFIQVDLRDQAGIDAAIDACGGPVHAVFACAGVADGTDGLERINFLGHRHLIERMAAEGTIPRGGSVGMISSAAGLGWESNLAEIKEYLATTDMASGTAWAQEHNRCDYMWSKQTMNTYVAAQAFPLLQKGIRINAICPGPTDTPLAQANAETWLGFGTDYREAAGIAASTPEEQAYPLVFLGSDAASHVSGIIMITDAGYMASGLAGSYEPAVGAAMFLFGRL